MAANKTRGEISLELDGCEYVLRPSFEAISAFEAQTNRSLIDLARAAGEGQLKTGEAAIIVTECIRAHGRATDDKAMASFNTSRVGELMIEADGGLLIVTKRLELLLFMAATGGYTGSGEVKAAKKNV